MLSSPSRTPHSLKMNHEPVSRRSFFHTSSLVAGAPLLPCLLAHSETSDPLKNEICVFNKPIQHLNYRDQAEVVAELGFDGIEGTVRKGGHVTPERVTGDLPKQIEALKSHGLSMTIMTTDVNEIESEIHQSVITTAAQLGIKRFRMGGIKYDPTTPIPAQLESIKKTFSDLVSFCEPLGIQPLYQNHAGAGRLGAGIWDLYHILNSLPPGSAGIAYDIRHATVEGAQSWPTEFDLMRPHFGMVYCKDFHWVPGSRKPQNVPLGTGMVDYLAFIKRLRKSSYTGPISLHMEYKNHRDPALMKESIEAIRSDKKTLDKLLK